MPVAQQSLKYKYTKLFRIQKIKPTRGKQMNNEQRNVKLPNDWTLDISPFLCSSVLLFYIFVV